MILAQGARGPGFNSQNSPVDEALPLMSIIILLPPSGRSQFARVVKGVDLRSTGGNSAWVRAPQLTSFESDGGAKGWGMAEATKSNKAARIVANIRPAA